jgi:hypothetical protein
VGGNSGNDNNDENDGIVEGDSAQDDHDVLDILAHVLAVQVPIVDFADQIVDACESPFLSNLNHTILRYEKTALIHINWANP